MRRPGALAAVLGAALVAAVALPARAAAATRFPAPAMRQTLSRPAAAGLYLGSPRLEFGLSNGPSELSWMTASGVPWKYRFQYLAGGVNTPNPWETWQDPAKPPGQFVLDYQAASAGAGYLPVYTYYELLQSNPSSGNDERARDYSNLTNAATMKAYYADFAFLMDKLNQAGGPALVHVEPDLWGYLEQLAPNPDATRLVASVAGSGSPETSGLPDTVAGFADALLRIRDRHAPNVLLAIHASPWGTNRDIDADTDPSLDATAVADQTAAFLNSAGVASNPYGSTWDAVFHDIDDHAAGWWEATGQTSSSSTHWWDPNNLRVPDFNRWLTWVGELHARTAKPQVVWQVPMGNQYFQTMDNTCGHYQDNVGPWMIAHPEQLRTAGLAGVMFGGGNSCQPTYDDTRGDGVTNGPGHAISDAQGFCNACTTHVSTVSDDDGGYLRIFVGAYYQGHPLVPPTSGYWMLASDGGIFPFGNAAGLGSMGGTHLNLPVVGMAATPSHAGYWLVASDGGIFPFGDATQHSFGSTGGVHLNAPIVGMAAAAGASGYWLVAADGGIFPFGPGAGGYGSTGAMHLNAPIVGMAATHSGHGYWLVASDGGIFPFGDALQHSHGSTGGIHLNRPIVAMTPTPSGDGYWLVASDGGIFPFGDALQHSHGSTGGMHLNAPIVGMAATPDAGGYWLTASDGGLFTFGDALGWGSMGGQALNAPIVAMAASV